MIHVKFGQTLELSSEMTSCTKDDNIITDNNMICFVKCLSYQASKLCSEVKHGQVSSAHSKSVKHV